MAIGSNVSKAMPANHYRNKKRYKVNLPEQLMECEMNYRRLQRLLTSLDQLAVGIQRQVIIGMSEMAEAVVSFSVVEQTKYTTVVHIVHHFPLQKTQTSIKNVKHENETATDPFCGKLRRCLYQGDVRLYHDADVAEVVKCQRYQQFKPRYEYPNVNMHHVDEKAQINRFLGELLAHCLEHGRIAEPVFV